jgi:hypothetical protein
MMVAIGAQARSRQGVYRLSKGDLCRSYTLRVAARKGRICTDLHSAAGRLTDRIWGGISPSKKGEPSRRHVADSRKSPISRESRDRARLPRQARIRSVITDPPRVRSVPCRPLNVLDCEDIDRCPLRFQPQTQLRKEGIERRASWI